MKVKQNERKLPKYISWHNAKQKYFVRYHGESFYEVNLARAKKRLQQLQKAEKGEIVEDITIDSIFAAWITEHQENVKPQTISQYKYTYTKLIKPYFGNLEPMYIDASSIKEHLYFLSNSGYGQSKISTVKTLLGQIFDYAIVKGYIDTNPAKAVKMPIKRWKDDAAAAKAAGKVKALTQQQQEIFEQACRNSFYGNIFKFQLATGCRIGEATALTWSDIDYANKKIRIRKTISYVSGKTIVSTPKSLSGYRVLPLTDDIASILDDQRQINNAIATKSNIVFANKSGNCMTSAIIHNALTFILAEIQSEDSDFPTITSHWCRHTFATRAVEAGVDFKRLQYILGHSTITITLDLYSHVLPDTLAAEFDKIAAVQQTQNRDTIPDKNVSGTVK